jgi:hypothetical protein
MREVHITSGFETESYPSSTLSFVFSKAFFDISSSSRRQETNMPFTTDTRSPAKIIQTLYSSSGIL